MKKIISLELKKAVCNKFFLISILIGMGFALLSLFYNVGVYQEHLKMQEFIESTSSATSNPVLAMFTVFNHWLGGEAFSLGSSIFFFVFPLLVALPYGWSYCEEKRCGYNRSIVTRSGKNAYFVAKYVAIFVSGGLAMVIPLVFSFAVSAAFFPSITPVAIYSTGYGVFENSLMSMLYYTMPFLYVCIYLCIDFVFAGLITCLCFAVSTVVKYGVIVVILPLFMLLLFHYLRQFVYISMEVVHREISPLYFLRGVCAAYDTSWTIILVEAIVLFAVTIIPSVVWERRNEIY